MYEEILLQHENQPKLRFTGQLIGETQFRVESEDEAIREFNLRAYAIEGGGFVAMLRYETTSEAENELVWYEEMDQFKDVENFFFVLVANEFVRDYKRLSRSDRELAGLICQQITKAYETSMFKFLDVLRSRCLQQQLVDRVEEKLKPSIFRRLGLKR